VVEYVRSAFGRFADPDEHLRRHECSVLRDPAGGWRIQDGAIDARVANRAWLEGIAAARILENAGNQVRTHDLFHAAAVGRGGRAVVLAGDSGHGKSLITLGLLQRGWAYLSDEVCALSAAGPRIDPFPKALEVAPAGFATLGLPAPEATPCRRGKVLVDPPAAHLGLPPAAVVLLACGSRPPRGAAVRTLRVAVHRDDPSAIDAVASCTGVLEVRRSPTSLPHTVLALTADDRFEAWRLDEILGAHGVLITAVDSDPPEPTSFVDEPALESLPSSAGIVALLARLRGRKALAETIARRFGGSFSAFVDSVAMRLAGVRFFRMRVGRLHAALDLLDGLVP